MQVVMIPLEVIAYFTRDGRPVPVKFRLEQENRLPQVVKVGKVIATREEKLGGNLMYIYHCRSTTGGVERVFELKYEPRTCRWFLFRV